MEVVCNSSPLIFLCKIGRINILHTLFSKVYAPVSVYQEIIASGKDDDACNQITKMISSKEIDVFGVKNEVAIRALMGRLHLGEVEVIIGAKELNINNVILDDGYARKKAKFLGLSVVGTLGILKLAHKKGFIESFEDELKRLINVGFRISAELMNQILAE